MDLQTEWTQFEPNYLLKGYLDSIYYLYCISSLCLPALQMAFMWLQFRGSWKTMTVPSCPCKEVGLPHSLSWVPAEMSFVIDSDFVPSNPPHVCAERMPPREDRVVGVVEEEKGGSGIWDGGGVVVRWPAEPMQHEVNGC